MRIVSYNVRYFSHALRGIGSTRGTQRRIAGRLSSLDELPALMCLQEVETASLRSNVVNRRRTPGETQLEAFMAEIEAALAATGRESPYEAFYFRAHTYKLRSVNVYTTGLAILVDRDRFSVDSHNVEAPEHITHHHVALAKDRKQTRICAHMRLVDSEGRGLHVFNCHLSLPTPFTRTFWRSGPRMGWGPNQLQEARTLVSFIERQANGEPFVLCGDFNASPGSPVYRYLVEERGFCSAQATLGQHDGETPHAFATAGFMHLRMHLDHFFSRGLDWADLDGTRQFGDRESSFHGLSDHVPLIGRIRLQA